MIKINDASNGQLREIVDWHAGSPVYAGDEAAIAATGENYPAETHGRFFWVLKPGDLVCDWLSVVGPDNRGLLRLLVNLALYSKIVGACALIFF